MHQAHEVEAELRQAPRLLPHAVAARGEERVRGEIRPPEARFRTILENKPVVNDLEKAAPARGLFPGIQEGKVDGRAPPVEGRRRPGRGIVQAEALGRARADRDVA